VLRTAGRLCYNCATAKEATRWTLPCSSMSWRSAPYSCSSALSCWGLSEFGNESNDNAKGRIIAAADGGTKHRGRAPVFVFVMAAPGHFVPGVSRPSTSFVCFSKQDVDARHKAGHDGACHSAAWRAAEGS